MCKNYLCFYVECFNPCFWISTFLVPIITYLVIQGLRPRLSISALEKQPDCIKISIINKSLFFDANNLRIEVCVFNKNEGFTYHFEPDHPEFLILPAQGIIFKRDNTKKFVCRKASNSAMYHLKLEADNGNLTDEEGFQMLMDKTKHNYKIRVRCHAYHSFSGLGKSFENVF